VPNYARSSFARAFFEAGEQGASAGGVFDDDGGGTNRRGSTDMGGVRRGSSDIPMPKGRKNHRRSIARPSRVGSISSIGGGGGGGVAAAAAAVAALHRYETDSEEEKEDVETQRRKETNQEQDVEEILTGSVTTMNSDELGGHAGRSSYSSHQQSFTSRSSYGGGAENAAWWDNREVLEQYRLMAKLEADSRIEENTGMSVDEYKRLGRGYVKRNNVSGSAIPRGTLGRDISTASITSTGSVSSAVHRQEIRSDISNRRPASKTVSASSQAKHCLVPQVDHPDVEKMRIDRRILELRYRKQTFLRVPDISEGVLVESSSSIKADRLEHVVRCLGCRARLRMHILASMVRCPECQTVSPASSTRR